jgi:hypothetical protein
LVLKLFAGMSGVNSVRFAGKGVFSGQLLLNLKYVIRHADSDITLATTVNTIISTGIYNIPRKK